MDGLLGKRNANDKNNDWNKTHMHDIKQEPDDPEDAKTDSGECHLNYNYPEIGKVETVKALTISNDGSTKVSCDKDDKYSVQKTIKHYDSQKTAGFNEEHGGYNVTENLKHDLDIKEEKTDFKDAVTDIEKDTDTEIEEVEDNLELARWFTCRFCEYRTKAMAHLKQHFTNKHDTSPVHYKCQFCEYSSKSKTNLKRHFTIQHDPNVELFHCQHCSFKTKHKASLDVHTQWKHIGSWHQCPLCEYKTKHKNYLKKHHKIKHETEKTVDVEYKDDSSVKWYQCQTCVFKTKNLANLKRHFAIKHNPTAEWHRCPHCKFKTKHEDSLGAHIEYKHDSPGRWYLCRLCEFITKHTKSLRQHYEVKHGQQMELVRNSPYKFDTLYCKDEKNYSFMKPYKCRLCEFVAETEPVLRQHFTLEHDLDAEWRCCPFCEFKTKHRGRLRYHRKTMHEDQTSE